MSVEDDGRGISPDQLRQTAVELGAVDLSELDSMSDRDVVQLILRPGFSSTSRVTETSGRGVGLDVVRTNVQAVDGAIRVVSKPGRGAKFDLEVPVTLAITRLMIVSVSADKFAIPIGNIERTAEMDPAELRDRIVRRLLDEKVVNVPVVRLTEMISGLAGSDVDAKKPVVFFRDDDGLLGIIVDHLIDEQRFVIKPLGKLLSGLPFLVGAAIIGEGDIAFVLDSGSLVRSASSLIPESGQFSIALERPPERKGLRVLVVDDSAPSRQLGLEILEALGHEVHLAVDGLEATSVLGSQEFDLVITDLEMPHLNGFELAGRIRDGDCGRPEMPIIMLTSSAPPGNRRRAAQLGIDSYITKDDLAQDNLIRQVEQLTESRTLGS